MPRGPVPHVPLPDSDLHTVPEVAAHLRVSEMTVYRLVHSGHLRGIRAGRSWRIPATAVADYLGRPPSSSRKPTGRPSSAANPAPAPVPAPSADR